jgi:hypothetical protein
MVMETLTSLKNTLDEALDRAAKAVKCWRENDRMRRYCLNKIL